MSQHEVYELLNDLGRVDEKLFEARKKAQATTRASQRSRASQSSSSDEQDLQRLFLMCSSNLNELEKTVSRLRNELTELYKTTNNKLDQGTGARGQKENR